MICIAHLVLKNLLVKYTSYRLIKKNILQKTQWSNSQCHNNLQFVFSKVSDVAFSWETNVLVTIHQIIFPPNMLVTIMSVVLVLRASLSPSTLTLLCGLLIRVRCCSAFSVLNGFKAWVSKALILSFTDTCSSSFASLSSCRASLFENRSRRNYLCTYQ